MSPLSGNLTNTCLAVSDRACRLSPHRALFNPYPSILPWYSATACLLQSFHNHSVPLATANTESQSVSVSFCAVPCLTSGFHCCFRCFFNRFPRLSLALVTIQPVVPLTEVQGLAQALAMSQTETSSHLIGWQAKRCPHIRAGGGRAPTKEGGEEVYHSAVFVSVFEIPATYLHLKIIICGLISPFYLIELIKQA